jgi:hypothetical protein
MRRSITVLSALVFLGLGASIAGAAESKAVQTMAGILVNLNHFPSAADKQSLQQIADDKSSTADEKTVAQALMNVQHMPAAADKPKLEVIAGDAKASGGVKTLADVIARLNHHASDADKEKLKALMQ